MASSCKKGYYFCNSSQKCKRIPRGHKVQSDGELVREYVSDWRSDLGENLGIKMPTVRPGQFTSTGGRGKPVDLPNPDSKQFKSTGGRGKAVDLPKVKSGQFKEEIQGGISVEPYTKDTKFLEVETVDIIKPKALNASDWRSELDILDEGRTTIIKGIKVRGSGHPKDSASGTNENPLLDYSKIRASKEEKKETVAASYEADLENLIVEMLEEDIQALYENGFSYDEVAEFYGIEQDLTEVWGAVGRGAWEGAKIIAKKVAKPALNYAKNRVVKDIKTVSKFVRNPQNWKRANQDFDKLAIPAAKGVKNVANFVKQLPARTYAGAQKVIQGTQNTVKALKPAVDKVKSTGSDLVKKTGPTIQKGAKKFSDFVLDTYSKVEKNVGQAIVNRGKQDVALRRFDKAKVNIWKDKIAADKLSKSTDKVGDVINVAVKGKKAKKITNPWNHFWKKDPSRNISNVKVQKASSTQKQLGAGRENLLNKLRSTVTNIKMKGGALATVAKDKGGALVSKVKSLAKQAKEKTKQLTGVNPKATLPSSTTSKLTTISKKSNLKGIKTAALTTGLVAGGLTSSNRKDKITASDDVSTDKSKDPSTITNDGKKSVDPKKNEVVTKTTTKKTSTTPKGRTKWVGANTTWVDRHGNVIAPKAKENKKYKYGRTGSHLKPLEQEQAN